MPPAAWSRPGPRTGLPANLPCAADTAGAGARDYFSISHYDDAAIRDAELRRLAGLVTIHMSEDMRGTAVKVTLSDGAVLESPVIMGSRGSPKNPLPTPEIEEALYRAAKRLGLKDAAVQRAVALLRNVESVGDCSEIMRLLGDQDV